MKAINGWTALVLAVVSIIGAIVAIGISYGSSSQTVADVKSRVTFIEQVVMSRLQDIDERLARVEGKLGN